MLPNPLYAPEWARENTPDRPPNPPVQNDQIRESRTRDTVRWVHRS